MAGPTHLRRKRWSTLVGLIVSAVMFSAVAYADEIHNDLAGSARIIALNVDGATGSTTLTVVTENGDGKNGCNFQRSTTLSVSVVSSAPSVATVTPTSLTFGSCGDEKVLTVTPVGEGSSTITLTETSNNTGASFNLSPAAFRVDVAPPPNSAPDVSVTGVSHGASYAKGSDPTAGCSVDDAEDGSSTFAASLSGITGAYSSDGLGNRTATCSYTDKGGLQETVTATYSIYDPSAPAIGYSLNPASADGSNGWYTSFVSLTWSVGELESPNSLWKTGCENQNVTADQQETTYSCSALSAGGWAGQVELNIKRDATAPAVIGAPTTAANDAGWYNSDVSIEWLCLDATSGLAGPCPENSTISTEGLNLTASSGNVYDNAGNFSNATSSPAVKIDKTAPTLNCEPASTAWSASDVSIACTATDVLSNLANASDASFTLGTAVTIGTETSAALTDSRTVHDDAGNSIVAGPIGGIKVDKKAPQILCGSSDGDWHNDNVSIGCSAGDGGSGVAPVSDGSFSLSTTVPAGSENGNAPTGTKTVADGVGNAVTAGAITGNMIDRKGPVVSMTCPTGPVVLGSSASVSWTASDGGSGVADGYASGGITLSTSSVGVKTASVPAGTSKDNVGNDSARATCAYSVIYDWAGFFQPVDNLPTLNTVKAGSAVPVKFSLGGNHGLNVLAMGYPTSNTAACESAAGDDPIEATLPAGNSSLSYDAAANHYVYVWKTDKAWAGECRQLRVKLADGTLHAANFKLLK